jgi:PAS domain S-box-containing protein
MIPDTDLQFITLFISASTIMLMSLIIFFQSQRKLSTIMFAGCAFFASLWLFIGLFRPFVFFAFGPEMADLMMRFYFFFAIQSIGLYYLFFAVLCGRFEPKKLYFVIPAILHVVLSFLHLATDLVVAGHKTLAVTGELPAVTYGPAFLFFHVPFIFYYFGVSVYFLTQAKKTSTDSELIARLKYVFLGIIFSAAVMMILDLFYFNVMPGVAGLFLVVFMGLHAYGIFHHSLFDVRLIATELFIFLLWGLLLVRTIMSPHPEDMAFNAVMFVLTVIIGILLIKSSIKGEMSRQKAEGLANDLSVLNKGLKQMVLEKTKKTQAIIKYLADGLILLNSNGQIELINPQAERMLGVNEDHLLDRYLDEMADENPLFKAIVSKTRGVAGSFSRQEIALEDGRIFELNQTYLRSEDDQMGRLISIHDITKEKELEKIKDNFLSLAAHQLRTPLSQIRWALDVLTQDTSEKLDADQRSYINMIVVSNSRMVNLVNELLDVSKIESDAYRKSLVKEKVRAGEYFDALAKEWEGSVSRRGRFFKYERDISYQTTLDIDAYKIKTALYNIIDNARLYAPEGGTVSMTLAEDRELLKVEISNTGPSIPESQQEKIFEKFFREDWARKIHTEGAGLGLYISRGIIESHGGTLKVRSEEGQGATFIATIPVVKE